VHYLSLLLRRGKDPKKKRESFLSIVGGGRKNPKGRRKKIFPFFLACWRGRPQEGEGKKKLQEKGGGEENAASSIFRSPNAGKKGNTKKRRKRKDTDGLEFLFAPRSAMREGGAEKEERKKKFGIS